MNFIKWNKDVLPSSKEKTIYLKDTMTKVKNFSQSAKAQVKNWIKQILENREESVDDFDKPPINVSTLVESCWKDFHLFRVMFYSRSITKSLINKKEQPQAYRDFEKMIEELTLLKPKVHENFAVGVYEPCEIAPSIEDPIIKELRLEGANILEEEITPWAMDYINTNFGFILSQAHFLEGVGIKNYTMENPTMEALEAEKHEPTIKSSRRSPSSISAGDSVLLPVNETSQLTVVAPSLTNKSSFTDDKDLIKSIEKRDLLKQLESDSIQTIDIDITYEITAQDIVNLLKEVQHDSTMMKLENMLLEFILRAQNPQICAELDQYKCSAGTNLTKFLQQLGILRPEPSNVKIWDKEEITENVMKPNVSSWKTFFSSTKLIMMAETAMGLVTKGRDCLDHRNTRKIYKLRGIVDETYGAQQHLDAMKRDFKLNVQRQLKKGNGPQCMLSYQRKWMKNILQDINRMHTARGDYRNKLKAIDSMDKYLEFLATNTTKGDVMNQKYAHHIAIHKNHVMDEKLNKIRKTTSFYLMELIGIIETYDRELLKYRAATCEYHKIQKIISKRKIQLENEVERLRIAKENLKQAKAAKLALDESPMQVFTKDSAKDLYKCKKQTQISKASILRHIQKKIYHIDLRINSFKLMELQ